MARAEAGGASALAPKWPASGPNSPRQILRTITALMSPSAANTYEDPGASVGGAAFGRLARRGLVRPHSSYLAAAMSVGLPRIGPFRSGFCRPAHAEAMHRRLAHSGSSCIDTRIPASDVRW